ncbi:hypothetical protein ACIRQQ_08415 [Streptomyces fuscichromogenes]|uniref:hypothetical protein n=1 Tax=Streptomyces fuscichromogenes TaxID=1324013 RepID=UPI003805A72C
MTGGAAELSRVAVLSDIHGALPAEPDVATADRVVLTGAITAGPQPAGTTDALGARGDRVPRLSGDADPELVEHRGGERAGIPDPTGTFAADALRDDQADFLAAPVPPPGLHAPVRPRAGTIPGRSGSVVLEADAAGPVPSAVPTGACRQ